MNTQVYVLPYALSVNIVTERLVLRPLKLEDELDLYEYQSNSEIVKYIPWPARTLEQVQQALIKVISENKTQLLEIGDSINLAWELKSNKKVIGQSNLNLISKNDKTAEIGYVTHQDFQGKGFAYEASYALLNFGFSVCNLHRIVANIDTRMKPSAKLAEKLGMRLEATFIESEFFKGDWCNMFLYALLASEFNL